MNITNGGKYAIKGDTERFSRVCRVDKGLVSFRKVYYDKKIRSAKGANKVWQMSLADFEMYINKKTFLLNY